KSNERIQDIVSCPVSVRLCSHRAVAPFFVDSFRL
ncbi:unnamed protein product, partial [Tenebrio molitor]